VKQSPYLTYFSFHFSIKPLWLLYTLKCKYHSQCFIIFRMCNICKKSSPHTMPCCHQSIHETCLEEHFLRIPTDVYFHCPYCEQRLAPQNCDEPFVFDNYGVIFVFHTISARLIPRTSRYLHAYVCFSIIFFISSLFL